MPEVHGRTVRNCYCIWIIWGELFRAELIFAERIFTILENFTKTSSAKYEILSIFRVIAIIRRYETK